MSSSDQNLIASINNASDQINRYLTVIIYLFGTIGNILNIIVLSQRTLRSNSCAFLFLTLSIACLSAVLSGLTNRVAALWTPDLSLTIDWLCKFRCFILLLSRMISFWLLMLATVDRWLLSCTDVRQRQRSTLKNAQRSTVIVCIVSLLLNAPIIFCYKANLITLSQKCYGSTAACRIYSDTVYACVSITIPSLLMMYFSIKIILNVRRTQHRVNILNMPRVNVNIQNLQINNIIPRRRKKNERQLLLMLLVEVIFMIILTFPQAIQKLYTTMTLDVVPRSKSPLQVAIENFLFNFVALLTYLASGLPFYIYTLSGSVFRNAAWQIVRKFGRKLICQNNEG